MLSLNGLANFCDNSCHWYSDILSLSVAIQSMYTMPSSEIVQWVTTTATVSQHKAAELSWYSSCLTSENQKPRTERPKPPKKMIYDIITILCFPLSLKLYRAIPASGQFRWNYSQSSPFTITWNLCRCDDERLTFRVPDSGETVPVRLLFQSCYIPVIFIVRNYKTISQINLLFQDRVWGIYELKKLHKCL